MQMLLRVAAEEPARGACTRYTLTEIGDECRHSLMPPLPHWCITLRMFADRFGTLATFHGCSHIGV